MKKTTRISATLLALVAGLSMLVVPGAPASAATPQTMTIVSDATWTVDGGAGTSQVIDCFDWFGSLGWMAPAQWMWDRSCPLTSVPGEHHVFSKSFTVPGSVLSASLSYDIDNTGSATVNGQPAGSIPDWYYPVTNLNVTSLLHSGTNTIAVDATDLGGIAGAIVRLNITYTTSNVVQTKDDCKNGGWANVTRPDGSAFKNQGDCVSYVASGGRSDAH